MDSFIIYLAKVASAHVLIFLIYHTFLRRGTHFGLNRVFLLAGIIIPFIIPLIKIRATTNGVDGVASVLLDQVNFGIGTEQAPTGSGLTFLHLIIAIYLTGLVFMMIRAARQVLIIRQIHKTSVSEILNGSRIRIAKERVPACSFFNNIYLDKVTSSMDDINRIILHEKVHIRQLHSIDVILAEMICVFLWFNPISWKIRGALKETHEFLADAGVRKSDPDTYGYFTLLTNLLVGIQPAFSNQFNQSLTLKRLKMMTKNRSGRFAPMKALLGIPLLVLLVIAFSGRNNAGALIAVNDNALAARGLDLSLNSSSGNTGIKADTPPQYPGGEEAMMKFMKQNLRYPEAAKKAGKMGVVYVQFTVTTKGSITAVKVKTPVEATLDAEAVRVVSMMPDWIPGQRDGKPVSVEMVLPVNFKLEEK